MSDKTDKLIRRKALRAARAVTMGAALVAAGCSSDTTDTSNSGWNVNEDDASADASQDIDHDTRDIGPDTRDIGPDTRDIGHDTRDASPDVAPDVAPDAAPTCSDDFDQVCPNTCEMWEDADCCEQMGGSWGPNGGCAVPGPFVPPSMPA